MTAKSGRGTARQTIRIPDDEWDEFGLACDLNEAERSAYVLETIRYALGRPGTEAPAKLPGALPSGIFAHIEGRTLRDPKGRTVYSLTARAAIDDVARVIGTLALRLMVEGQMTRIETLGDLAAIRQVRELLLAAGVEIVTDPTA